MNPRQRIGQILSILVSVAGVAVSVLLLAIHARTKVGDIEGASQLCGESAAFDCSVAAASSWSEVFGLPIAGFGLAFYLGVILVAVLAPTLIDPKDEQRITSTPSLVVFGAFTLALFYSIFLAIVNVTQLDKSCDKCMWLYAVNAIGFVAAGLWAGGSPLRATTELFVRLPKTLFSPAAAIFVLTFLTATGGALWQTNRIIADAAQAPTPITISEALEDTSVLYRDDAATAGPADAVVHLVEFSDFECPYCAKFAVVIQELKEAFPNDLRVTFRNYPLSFHPNARLISRMAVCANEQRNFWPFHDMAFAEQRTLNAEPLSAETLLDLAKRAGLNVDEAKDCFESSFSETRVQRDVADGQAVKLRGTPTVFINGRQYEGPLDFENFRRVIQNEIDAAAEAGTALP